MCSHAEVREGVRKPLREQHRQECHATVEIHVKQKRIGGDAVVNTPTRAFGGGGREGGGGGGVRSGRSA